MIVTEEELKRFKKLMGFEEPKPKRKRKVKRKKKTK